MTHWIDQIIEDFFYALISSPHERAGIIEQIRKAILSKLPSFSDLIMVREKCPCGFCECMIKTGTGNWCKDAWRLQGYIERQATKEDINGATTLSGGTLFVYEKSGRHKKV